MKIDCGLYMNLICDYVAGKISAKCFEGAYLKAFIEEKREVTDEEYCLLNGLFMDVEAFCDDPTLITHKEDIDEKELKRRCVIALRKLRKLSSRRQL